MADLAGGDFYGIVIGAEAIQRARQFRTRAEGNSEREENEVEIAITNKNLFLFCRLAIGCGLPACFICRDHG
jgi:hypothetical protein